MIQNKKPISTIILLSALFFSYQLQLSLALIKHQHNKEVNSPTEVFNQPIMGEECVIVSALRCIQDELPKEFDNKFVDQIFDLYNSYQKQNSKKEKKLENLFLQLIADKDTGKTWLCEMATFTQNAKFCSQEGVPKEKQNQSPKQLRKSSKVMATQFTEEIQQFPHKLHKSYQHLSQSQEKCLVYSIVSAVQEMDKNNDAYLIGQMISLYQNGFDIFTDPEQYMSEIISLICGKKTGKFWEVLAQDIIDCIGLYIDISAISC